MIRANLIFMVFFLSVTVIFSQSYDIVYHQTKTFKIGSSNLGPEMEKKLKKMYDGLINVFTLEYRSGKSRYYKKYDLVDGEIDTDPRRMTGHGTTYKDFSEMCYVQIADFIGKNTAVRERFDEIFEWKMDLDRDTVIAGFQCKRATTLYGEDLIVAWYSKSIPIMDGPFRYAGLPGLILRTETGSAITEVADIQVIKNNNEEIIIPEKKKYISFKEMKESRTLTVKAKRIKKKNGQNHK